MNFSWSDLSSNHLLHQSPNVYPPSVDGLRTVAVNALIIHHLDPEMKMTRPFKGLFLQKTGAPFFFSFVTHTPQMKEQMIACGDLSENEEFWVSLFVIFYCSSQERSLAELWPLIFRFPMMMSLLCALVSAGMAYSMHIWFELWIAVGASNVRRCFSMNLLRFCRTPFGMAQCPDVIDGEGATFSLFAINGFH